MGETSDEIVRRIRETRNDLSENIDELQDKVKNAVDWKAQFEQHPGAMLGLAFAGGVLLSAVLPSIRSSSHRSASYDWENNLESSPAPDSGGHSRKPSRSSPTVDAIKNSLIALAATRLTAFVNDLLPGFEREFSNARSNRGQDFYRPEYSEPGRVQ
jgi:hypothetical protein